MLHAPSVPHRMRLLVVTARYPPLVGGTEIHSYQTASRLAREGAEVTVLTANPGNALAPEEWSDGVHVVRIRAWSTGSDLYLAPSLFRLVSGGDWDLVHCQGSHTLFAPLAMLAAAHAGIPYVVTFHSGGHSSGWRNAIRPVQWTLLRPLFARAAALIGVSRFEAEFFRRLLRLDAERFHVIPNGSELPHLAATGADRPEKPLIVSVGRLERYKGHQRVIAALPHVLSSRPDARLRIVGRGPFETSLRQLASELGVSERVEIGGIDGEDRGGMAALLARAALVVSLSEYESQGIAVMEAVHLQRPVLVADASALHELAERGLAHAVALDSTPRQLAAAILERLGDPAPAPPPAEELPTWDACVDQLRVLYAKVARSQVCVS